MIWRATCRLVVAIVDCRSLMVDRKVFESIREPAERVAISAAGEKTNRLDRDGIRPLTGRTSHGIQTCQGQGSD